MSRIAGERIAGTDFSGHSLQGGVAEWAVYTSSPTEQNFWRAHNAALYTAARSAYALGYYQEETVAERLFIDKVLTNVSAVGDGCALGYGCTISSELALGFATSTFYPASYPISNWQALWVPPFGLLRDMYRLGE